MDEKQFFDSKLIGVNIMKLRKAAGLTQMQLAETLGISFQAVSNWERGQSCPDIARLTELAQFFNVTTDEILGSKKGARVVDAIAKDEEIPALSAEEMLSVAPLLSQEQADEAAEKVEHLTLTDLVQMAPFLSQELLDEAASRMLTDGVKVNELAAIAPFLSDKALDALVEKVMSRSDCSVGGIISIAPFLGDKALDSLAQHLSPTSFGEIIGLAPFLREETLNALAEKMLDKPDGSLAELAGLAPFLGKQTLTHLVEAQYARGGSTHELMALLPFLDEDEMAKFFMRRFETKGDRNDA